MFLLVRMGIWLGFWIGSLRGGILSNWDFTTAMRFGQEGWWFGVVGWHGGEDYRRELGCDVVLNNLTVDSYVPF